MAAYDPGAEGVRSTSCANHSGERTVKHGTPPTVSVFPSPWTFQPALPARASPLTSMFDWAGCRKAVTITRMLATRIGPLAFYLLPCSIVDAASSVNRLRGATGWDKRRDEFG